MPVVFAELASRYRPKDVSDPNSPAAANGQYILINRKAYEAVGGHAALAGELLEDVALACAVKQSGRKIFFRYGADAVRTRMYRNFAQLREGWTKNLALLFPNPNHLALQVVFMWLLAWAAPVLGILLSVQRPVLTRGIVITLLAIPLLRLGMYLRRANFSLDAGLLAMLFGPPLFAYLLCRSAWAHRNGKVSWKGRSYTPPPNGQQTDANDPRAAAIENRELGAKN